MGSLAVGVKLYAEPALTAVVGTPLIVGFASTGSTETVTVKAGSESRRGPVTHTDCDVGEAADILRGWFSGEFARRRIEARPRGAIDD